jgi:hypothetical protein
MKFFEVQKKIFETDEYSPTLLLYLKELKILHF